MSLILASFIAHAGDRILDQRRPVQRAPAPDPKLNHIWITNRELHPASLLYLERDHVAHYVWQRYGGCHTDPYDVGGEYTEKFLKTAQREIEAMKSMFLVPPVEFEHSVR